MKRLSAYLPHNRFDAEQSRTSHSSDLTDREKQHGYTDSPVPFVTWRSLALGAFVSIGGLIFGYDTGQISGFLEMENFQRRFGQLQDDGSYKFSNVRSGLIVAMLSIGTLLGALMAGPLADRIGRKWSISFWCIILHVGLIIQISSPHPKWYQFMMGRFVTGFGVGACSLLVPLYQGETSPRQIRGAMVCSYQLFVTLGIFVAYCINFGTESMSSSASWRITLGITFLWGLLLGIGIIFFPESPRYDYRHGRIDKAKSTMAKLYGVPQTHRVVVQELAEIKDQLEAEGAAKRGIHGLIEMFQGPRMRYRIILGVTLQALQQLTGANYFFYYGTVIFRGAGISNSFVTQMILGGVNFGTTFGGLYIVEHFGRRKSLITGGIWMFCCFMVFASIGHFSLNIDDPPATPGAGKAMVVFACLFITGFATTWGPMIWALIAEIYPSFYSLINIFGWMLTFFSARYRAKGMALATASNWLWNFLLSFFTPFITGAIDFAYGYVFAGCLFVAVLVVYFFVLEGKGKTLEEIDMMYVMHVPPWESSKWVPPPPEERVTTANVLDQRAARNMADEEEQGKRGQYGPGHQHIDQDGAGPSVSGTV